MEADSTTYENNSKAIKNEPCLPFSTCPSNYKIYKDFISNNGEKSLESQLIERMQNFGLLPNDIKCPTDKPNCKVICKSGRVVDRVQWVCEGCGKRQPIRAGSFFFRLQCSILQTLQIILAWCEDADCEVAAEHFGVKPKVACAIYYRLDELAIREYNKCLLGGENSVVLVEMYPECLNRLSPDTTDQPHVHRILMLADTNHIPTYYRLHVIKDDHKKTSSNSSLDEQALKTQVEDILSKATTPNSILVTGNNVPIVDGASTIQQLVQHCDVDMQRFLTSRIWRQAISLCSASRDLCVSSTSTACAGAVQRYLHVALYRLRYGDGFYDHILRIIAEEFTSRTDRIIASS